MAPIVIFALHGWPHSIVLTFQDCLDSINSDLTLVCADGSAKVISRIFAANCKLGAEKITKFWTDQKLEINICNIVELRAVLRLFLFI